MFDRPLLRLDANGCRYFIARYRRTGELSFVCAARDGGFNWSRLGDESGMSTEPWDEWVMAGRLPSGAREVQVDLGISGRVRTKTRPGLWMAAVEWHGKEHDGQLVFVNGEGRVVERRDAWIPPRA